MQPLVEILSDRMGRWKTIAGNPAWAITNREGQHRWLTALEIDGSVSDLTLVIDAYPRNDTLRFTISLICGASLCRLDYWEHDRHLNHVISGVSRPSGVDYGWLHGPHIHRWEDNKAMVKNEPPKELEFAVELPANVKGFENAFRYFCGLNRIILDEGDLPTLPARDTLL